MKLKKGDKVYIRFGFDIYHATILGIFKGADERYQIRYRTGWPCVSLYNSEALESFRGRILEKVNEIDLND